MVRGPHPPQGMYKRATPYQAARQLELRRREHYQALSQSSLGASCTRVGAGAGAGAGGARRGPSLSEALSLPPASPHSATMLAPLAQALASMPSEPQP